MGSVVLGNVVTALEGIGLAAGLAYPGGAFPKITEPVAAVHLKQVDSSTRTATVEVLILSPAAQGGSVCEAAALDALRALWALGAACRQEGCRYDSVSQLYRVSLTATFTQTVQVDTGPTLPGFSVAIDGVAQTGATSFRAQLETGAEAEYVAASAQAVASHGGTLRWTLRLEEQLPVGIQEPASPEGEFTLTVDTGTDNWRYLGCRWTIVSREYTVQGLHRVRTGFALSREEV